MDDIDINQIDYKFVEECNDKTKLRKALKILKADGGYFPELEKTIEEKLMKIDKKYVAEKTNKLDKISPEDISKYTGEINEWENKIRDTDKLLQRKDEKSIYEISENDKIYEIEKKKSAENEKIKGNDYMKTKDFNDAIKHYSTSLKLDSDEPTTYCNRALAYIRIKRIFNANLEFELGLNDCNNALRLNSDYSKAFYRRAICYLGLKRFQEAFDDLISLLSETPNNKGINYFYKEILDEINTTKEKWIEFVGKDEYNKYEGGINKRIFNAYNRIGDANNIKKKIITDKPKMEDKKHQQNSRQDESIRQVENQENISKAKSNKKEEFKKIAIIEEDSEEVSNQLEKKFEIFWKTKTEVAKQFEDLYKQKKFTEILDIARINLSECQNFMPELTSKPLLKSRLENKIGELNQFIQLCSKNIKLTDITETKLEDIKEEVENEKKFHKTPSLSGSKMENATKLAENEMSMDEFPKTANGFEKAFSSLKKNNESFYKYLSKFQPENLITIFEKIEMSFDLVVGIINCQKAFGLMIQESFIFSMRYFLSISKTKKFNLMKSFLKGKIRDELKQYIDEGKVKFKFNDETIIKEVEKAYFN